jgi:hypothetical protein
MFMTLDVLLLLLHDNTLEYGYGINQAVNTEQGTASLSSRLVSLTVLYFNRIVWMYKV